MTASIPLAVPRLKGNESRYIQQCVDAEITPVTDPRRVRPERSEVQILQSDPTRAKELLGWEPTVRLQNGLSETVKWLRGRVNPLVAARYER